MASLRLLCFSDLHLDASAANRLAGRGLVEPVDFLVSADDLAVDGLHSPELYDALTAARRPVLAVPGNHDGDAPYREMIARSGWIDLDGEVVEHDGWVLAGWGIRRYDRQLSGPDRATQSHDPALARLAERLSGFPSERVVLAMASLHDGPLRRKLPRRCSLLFVLPLVIVTALQLQRERTMVGAANGGTCYGRS
jgi:3',5'-cyclic AMP phosphodiesterase CpdA